MRHGMDTEVLSKHAYFSAFSAFSVVKLALRFMILKMWSAGWLMSTAKKDLEPRHPIAFGCTRGYVR